MAKRRKRRKSKSRSGSSAGRDSKGRIKKGYRLTKGGRVVKSK